MTSNLSWGSEPTQFFYKITPDKVISAVESSGVRCTGRCIQLNSMENRVYELELESDETQPNSKSFCVVKFYRPGRWTREQILEEHQFLFDLEANEIPVIAPNCFSDGQSLHQDAETGIYYTLFPRKGGRAPEELNDESLERVGRLLARIHAVGSQKPASHRITLSPETYGRKSLAFLKTARLVPDEFWDRLESAVLKICEISEPWFQQTPFQRIHGDCHFGNILWTQGGATFLDFDDMVMGPPVQDLWLVVPGRDEEARRQFQVMLQAYESMRSFDRNSIRLIEPLRALRFIHFAAWIGKRWEDPAFPRTFPEYGSQKYWHDLTLDLEEQFRQTYQAANGGIEQRMASGFPPD